MTKKIYINNLSFDELITWFNALPNERKSYYAKQITAYYNNCNIFVEKNQIVDFTDLTTLHINTYFKKNKIKVAKNEIDMFSTLIRQFFTCESLLSIRNRLQNGETFPCRLRSKNNYDKYKSIFSEDKVYISHYTDPNNDQLFLRASNKESTSAENYKAYYLDPNTLKIKYINSYADSNEMIALENEAGIFVEGFLQSFFNEKGYYCLSLTSDNKKLKELNKIIGDDKPRGTQLTKKDD